MGSGKTLNCLDIGTLSMAMQAVVTYGREDDESLGTLKRTKNLLSHPPWGQTILGAVKNESRVTDSPCQ